MPVPFDYKITAVVQDTNGYKALAELPGYGGDISADAGDLGTIYALAQTYYTALAALSNAKIVEQSLHFHFNYAQRPTNAPALYPNVNQRAKLNFTQGSGSRMATSVPAPIAAMFVATAPDRGLVVDPAVTAVGNLITAIEAAASNAQGAFNEFDGGQLVGGKPRRRRVILGS